MTQATPVFVIGMTRSGTKWLTNIICNHSEVIGVQSNRHGGIVESNMFDVMLHKFDLAYSDDYVAFIDLWSRSDFFRLTGVDKRLFLNKPWSRDFLQIFVKLMNRFAQQNEKRFWVQKIGPACGLGLLDRLTGARFIVIERDFMDRVTSTIQLKRNLNEYNSGFEAVYDTVAQTKILKRILKRRNVLRVSYERLQDQRQSTISEICNHIGISFEPEMLRDRFQKNTSFKGDNKAKRNNTVWYSIGLRMMATGLNMIPLPVILTFSKVKSAMTGEVSTRFLPGTFSGLEGELLDLLNPNRPLNADEP